MSLNFEINLIKSYKTKKNVNLQHVSSLISRMTDLHYLQLYSKKKPV